jgi:hypothetical protein
VNRVALGLLSLAVVFQLIPSTSIFVCDMAGLNAFYYVGPFYIIGLLASGN